MIARGARAERNTGEAGEGGEIATEVAEAADAEVGEVAKVAKVTKAVAEISKFVAEAVERVTKRELTSWNLREGPQERSKSARSSSRPRRRKTSGESTQSQQGRSMSGSRRTWFHFHRPFHYFLLLQNPAAKIFPLQIQTHNFFRAPVGDMKAPDAITYVLVIEPSWNWSRRR